MSHSNAHQPVLYSEVISRLAIKSTGVYVDATFGRGGHAQGILDCLDDAGQLIAIDRDASAVAHASEKFGADKRFSIEHASFSQLYALLDKRQLVGKVDGIILDLGVSSPQLDDAQRGFSFMREGPLDMRMDVSTGMDAATWLNQAEEAQIATVIKAFGEERFARRIARTIVQQRTQTPLQTTKQLAELVAAAIPTREKHKHPATRTFQAIRIFINSEFDEIKACLEQCVEALAIGGRLVVISFHSLEDRIVKRFMQTQARGEQLPAGVPVRQAELAQPRLRLVCKAIKPGPAEVVENPRARSSVLRVAEKIS